MLLANLEIGFHEQTRLQPAIEGALNGTLFKPGDLADLLVQKLTGHEGKIAKAVKELWHSHDTPLRDLANLPATTYKNRLENHPSHAGFAKGSTL